MPPKDFFYSGYIEGCYGRLLSWKERRSLIDVLYNEGLNTYLYAPKEDIYHRQNWRIPYSEDWIREFRGFVRYADLKNISVIPSLSPGLTFDYTNKKDYTILLEKFLRFIQPGIQTAALLMDDIELSLPAKARKRFSSLGNAHGKLIRDLSKDIRKHRGNVSLWFCPTVYCDSMASKTQKESSYLDNLSNALPDNINILWTGNDVVSKYIDKKSLSKVSSLFNKNIILWDNLYANDYCPSRLFCGPLKSRNTNITKSVNGYMLNPTGLLHTDSFILSLGADFLKGSPAVKSWKKRLENFQIPLDYSVISRFFDSPFHELTPSDLSSNLVKNYINACRKLVFDWKGPFHREWYPYLFQLKSDLDLFTEISIKKPVKNHNILKRYPSLQSYMLKQL